MQVFCRVVFVMDSIIRDSWFNHLQLLENRKQKKEYSKSIFEQWAMIFDNSFKHLSTRKKNICFWDMFIIQRKFTPLAWAACTSRSICCTFSVWATSISGVTTNNEYVGRMPSTIMVLYKIDCFWILKKLH